MAITDICNLTDAKEVNIHITSVVQCSNYLGTSYLLQKRMGALTSIPLCQRARGAEEVGGGDNNNNLHNEEDRNIPQVTSASK